MTSPATQNRIVRCIDKVSQAASTVNGTGFSWWGFRHAQFILDLGALGAAATVDVKIQECDTIGGTYTDVTVGGVNAAFTQKLKTSTDDNKIFTADMALNGRKKFLRAVQTVAAAASVSGVTCILTEPDRTERVYQAQGASEAVAGPLTAAQIEFQLA